MPEAAQFLPNFKSVYSSRNWTQIPEAAQLLPNFTVYIAAEIVHKCQRRLSSTKFYSVYSSRNWTQMPEVAQLLSNVTLYMAAEIGQKCQRWLSFYQMLQCIWRQKLDTNARGGSASIKCYSVYGIRNWTQMPEAAQLLPNYTVYSGINSTQIPEAVHLLFRKSFMTAT